MPQAKSRRPEIAERSQTAILDAAKALFLELGYDAVSLDQVAERAGVSRQTVYNRFGGKEPMFRAMIERHWQVLDNPGAFPYPAAEGRTVDAAGVLRQVARALIYFIDKTDQIAFTRLVIGESRRLPWIGEAFHRLGKAAPLAAFAKGLEDMDADGLIDCPHPALAARQFIGLIQEFVVWPQVMAIGPAIDTLPPTDLVVEEAVAMFLARYQRRA
jgi:TetR/AcrR family transcriptional regulator, regulator of autoinduction and epiphytic fitness